MMKNYATYERKSVIDRECDIKYGRYDWCRDNQYNRGGEVRNTK